MPVDVIVEVGLRDHESGTEVMRKLASEIYGVRVDNVPLMRAREIGVVSDDGEVLFEASNTKDALVAAGLISTSLLKQGFAIRSPHPLVQPEPYAGKPVPTPGVAFLQVVAPLGTP